MLIMFNKKILDLGIAGDVWLLTTKSVPFVWTHRTTHVQPKT